MYWEPCGNHRVQGVSVLEHATSGAVGLVTKAWEAYVSAWGAAARIYAGVPLIAWTAHWWVLWQRWHCHLSEDKWFCLLHKIKATSVWEGEGISLCTGSAHCARRKPIWSSSHAVGTQSAQHLKRCKIYLLSVFLIWFYLIKAAILLCHLLLGLSYWHKKKKSPKQTRCLSLWPTKCRTGENPCFFERGFLSFFLFFKHTYSSKKKTTTFHGPYIAILCFAAQTQPLIMSS